jgi:hypothetical protein
MTHFCVVKREAMLSSISWLQFTAFILLGLVIYYCYVVVVYYGRELRQWVSGRPTLLPDAGAQLEQAGSIVEAAVGTVNGVKEMVSDPPNGQTAAVPLGQQPSLFQQTGSRIDGDVDIYKAADKAIGRIVAVLRAAKESPLTREEIENRLRSVLEGYGELKDTPHQEAINQIIQRACIHQFNVRVEADTLERIWN